MTSVFGMILGFLSANFTGGLAFVGTIQALVSLRWGFLNPQDLPQTLMELITGFLSLAGMTFLIALFGNIFTVPLSAAPALICIAFLKIRNIQTLFGSLVAGVICSFCTTGIGVWLTRELVWDESDDRIVLVINLTVSSITCGLVGGWIFRRVSNAVDAHHAERNERWQSSNSLRAQSQQLEHTIDKDEKSGELKVISNE